MKGIVVFKSANNRSKSEGCFPYLYLGNGEFVKIRMRNENPFENTLLKEFDCKTVMLEGEYNDTDTFIVSSICEATENQMSSCETKESETAR